MESNTVGPDSGENEYNEWPGQYFIAGAVLLIALTSLLKNMLEQTEKLQCMAESLFRRLRLHSCSVALLIFVFVFLIIIFFTDDSKNFASFAVLAGLTLAFWANVEIFFQMYRDEAELSVLLLATAMKYQTLATSFGDKEMDTAKCVWNIGPQNPEDPQCTNFFLCFFYMVVGWIRFPLSDFPSILPIGYLQPGAQPCWQKDDSAEVYWGKEGLFEREKLKEGILLPPCTQIMIQVISSWPRWLSQFLLGQIRRFQLLHQLRQQRLSFENTPRRLTANSECCFASATVLGLLKNQLKDTANHKYSHIHGFRDFVPEEKNLCILVSLEFAARIDLPDQFGNMLSSISETSGLGSHSKAWFVIGSEIVANLHVSLGIDTVEHPASSKEAQAMYKVLLALDSSFLVPEIQKAVVQRVVDQGYHGEKDTHTTLNEKITEWCTNHGSLDNCNNCTLSDCQALKKAIHWITIGLVIRWGGRNTGGLPNKLWTRIKETLVAIENNGFVKRMDSSDLAWYCTKEKWRSKRFENDIMLWAVENIGKEECTNIKEIAKEFVEF